MNRGRRGCGAEETERDETRTERGGRWGGEGDREEEKRRLAAGAVRSKVVFETRGGNRLAGKERERERERIREDWLSRLFFFFFSSSSFFLPHLLFSLSLLPISSFLLFPLSRCFYFLHARLLSLEKSVVEKEGREREREERRIAWLSRCLSTVPSCSSERYTRSHGPYGFGNVCRPCSTNINKT